MQLDRSKGPIGILYTTKYPDDPTEIVPGPGHTQVIQMSTHLITYYGVRGT